MAQPDDFPRDDNTLPPYPQPGGIAARAMANRAQPDYLNDLNPEQREAVVTLDGPVLVLAGAGTGKTRVLTTRIAHILATGRARPAEILSVTFTNKAAREMKERVGRMVGQIVEGMPWLGTFHSIGVKILRRHAELVGLKPDFTILDTDDQIRLMKQLIAVENLDEKRWPGRVLAQLIDGWKNRGLTPDQVPAGEGASFGGGKGKKLYTAYQERLKTLNAADFGDLLLECIRLFRTHPEVLRQYQNRFRYILVDEYQDTNVAQYLWLRLLAQSHDANAGASSLPDAAQRLSGLLSDAGDEDRALGAIGFRARALRRAPESERRSVSTDDARSRRHNSTRKTSAASATTTSRSTAGAGRRSTTSCASTTISPARRSSGWSATTARTAHILAAASHLIAHNEGRLGKTLRTEDVPGEKVQVTSCWDSEEEARSIGDEIEQLQRGAYGPSGTSEPHNLDEIAILVRASFQMREFEDRFVTLGLPYRVIGGPRFYERMEIRDALAYLRLVAQPADDLAFERIVNVPKRGLGDATLNTLHNHARKRRIPLMEATRAIVETDEMKPRPRNALRELVANFDRWRAMKDATPHGELAQIILDESGYTEMWQKDRSADAAGRLENLKELVRSMEEFENLAGFLEHISLVMDADKSESGEAVSIMTMHSAKGLEFDTVFLPGWEEGLFPSQRTLDDQGRTGLEEERRLAHVGLTRARRRAKIYFAANRRMHGLWSSNIPSRFLDELPEAQCRGAGGQGRLRLRHERLRQRRRLALRRDDAFRLELLDARLAARAGARQELHPARRRLRGGRRVAGLRGLRQHGHRRALGRRTHVARLKRRSWRHNRWVPSPLAGEGQGGGWRGLAQAATPPAAAARSPSKASSSPNPPAPSPTSRSATACFTRNSATATSPASTATSSRSPSTRPARSAWWIVLWSGCED